MKKLSLSPEDLAVESFETTAAEADPRGTVHGAQANDTACRQIICDCPTSGRACVSNPCGTDDGTMGHHPRRFVFVPLFDQLPHEPLRLHVRRQLRLPHRPSAPDLRDLLIPHAGRAPARPAVRQRRQDRDPVAGSKAAAAPFPSFPPESHTMKKIELSLDALHVESFATTESASAHRGTVRAAGASEDPACESGDLTCGTCGFTYCLDPSCGPPCEPTFPYSCGGTCIDETCDPECGPVTANTCLLTCPDC